MADFLLDLNDVQKQAVTWGQGPALILAGAGSGKTRVLTYRVVHLISQGINPQNILGVTFTNKAAEEMKKMGANYYVISGLDDRNEFWVTICYATQLAISKIKLSYEHDDFRWININEFEKLKMSPRNKKFVEKFKNISKISILEKKSRAV